ncbi:hypothetical protein BDY19DRAFT_913481 [Irpex rosettiformis]|uniref:Uncharacterized protein n=1 Tax=Irpex rosettiformis TaxID=378272 RepID=A0ACB8UK55_9APHY|nr:hypothetical protein BDY19DRAFT_913481 [Irpex rosettiformis]
MSRPSTSHQPVPYTNGVKRPHVLFDEARYEDPSYVGLPSNDTHGWYYPSHGYSSDEDDVDVRFNTATGNWGRKTARDARWIKHGKMAPWGPSMEEWEIEERARKRIKLLLPSVPNPDEPITLPHLRSPTPPLTSPYPTPNTQHLSYTSFVLDKSVTHAFRSQMMTELQQVTNNIIEGEATLRRALGRLWEVMSEDPDKRAVNGVVPKQEDDDVVEGDATEQRLSRAPDLTPTTHKVFITTDSVPPPQGYDYLTPEAQMETLEKSLAVLRDFQDDGREYVERLEEIREVTGDVKKQKEAMWDIVREKAIRELQDQIVPPGPPDAP